MAQAMRSFTDDADLLRLLEQEGERSPHTAEAFTLQRAILRARSEAAESASLPPGWSRVAAERIGSGQAALRAEHLTVDWRALRRLAERICAISAHHDPIHAAAFGCIASRLLGDTIGPEALESWVRSYLGDRSRPGTDLDPDLLTFVVTHAVRPFLRPYAAAVMALPESRGWARSWCPVCGGPPDFAALSAEAPTRHLLCARCDAEWTHRHLGCPYCGNDDPESLGYFLTGAAYRLYACERCKRYLKTVDFRETWLRRPLALERILTPGMDLAARQEGYRGL